MTEASDALAERDLPCGGGFCAVYVSVGGAEGISHSKHCPARHRPTVSARYAEKDAQIALLSSQLEGAKTRIGKLSRCLLPVWMGMAEAKLAGEPIPDTGVVLHFMGSGASDQVTAGEIRAALAQETDNG